MTNNNIPENYKRVAIVGGSGAIGSFITREFLKHGQTQVRVVTRKSNDNKPILEEYKSNGAEIVEVDYNQIDTLNEAFKNIDVVISTISGGDVFEIQQKLINAAVNSKVNLFIPSEFGSEIVGREDNILFVPKIQTRKVLENSGLNYIYYLNGFYTQFIITEFHGIDPKSHTANIIGKGDTELTVTDLNDLAKFVYQTYHLESVKNTTVSIVGQTTTINNILKDITSVTNKQFNINHITFEEAQKTLEDPNTDFFKKVSYILRKDIEEGKIKLPSNSNNLIPEFKFTSVLDYAKANIQ